MPKRSPIYCEVEGDFSSIYNFLDRAKGIFRKSNLDEYGAKGVEFLKDATPKSSPETREGWYYKVERKNNSASIIFYNNYVVNGNNIALVIQNGHATKKGNWVEGTDFITPALDKLREIIENDLRKEAK